MEGSFASPSADAQQSTLSFGNKGMATKVLDILTNLNGWQILLSVLLILVAYDQSTYTFHDANQKI